ncbi:MAG TPA: hypothetical protein VGZ68_10485 [Acidimicrobiales bacterium]|jgi:hypothetical protein|nr:hypothetical protein [Acidimicrobiales bacterium]
MGELSDDDFYARCAEDTSTLYAISRYLIREEHPVQIRLSQELAALALKAWQREPEVGTIEIETREQSLVRSASATLSQIGLTLESGFVVEGDEVVFTEDAWIVGSALDFADRADALGEE